MENSINTWPLLDPKQRSEDVKAYFSEKADRYDDVDLQPYWVFSDTLLWRLLQNLALDKYKKESGIKLIDVGAGTARWSIRILEYLSGCTATLIDLSQEMLAVAESKLLKLGLEDRVKIINQNINTLDAEKLGQHDISICFHNVLSFVSDPYLALKKIVTLTKNDGIILLVIPNYYHAMYFSIANKRFEEMKRLQERNAVKFADNVPEMLVFTPSKIAEILKELGVKDVKIYGFPVSLYPQKEETSIDESNQFAKSLFSDNSTVESLIKLEYETCLNEEAAARGNNLLVIASR